MNQSPDLREYAPATERNRQPILEVLQRVLPSQGIVLEIASGTGEHATFFAPRLQGIQWLPSDPDINHRASIEAWQRYFPSDNLYPPLALDVRSSVWPVQEPDQLKEIGLENHSITAIVCINMIHIAPWQACLGLMAGAGRILPDGGILYLYGPFKQGGKHTAESNKMFDESLRLSNREWGVRDLEEVIDIAQNHALKHIETIPMPANNLSVVFQRC
ncbi:DUF938 domain-containing protein [Capilliphycus salinus ALCB114379]|uniref:DUF938 domain-containing protein n=1 Tax=Capilliphycus salinus TaxID=2768948 RepID=UPI0039A6354E